EMFEFTKSIKRPEWSRLGPMKIKSNKGKWAERLYIILNWGVNSGMHDLNRNSRSNIKVMGAVVVSQDILVDEPEKVVFIWEDVINEILEAKIGNNIWSAVRRISLAAVVYFIWQERNQRIFKGVKRNASTLYADISEIIKMKLMNIRVKDSVAVRIVADIWEIKFKSPT
ncbi:hypothetical protein Tco_0943150, partial [Tanacetum coccineum]